MRTICVLMSLGVLTLSISRVSSQAAADISKKIDKETKPAGSEGRLNCTVAGLDEANGVVMWSKLEPVSRPISRGMDIVRKNPLGSKKEKKYEIFVDHLSKHKQIYILVVRRLTSEDSGFYMCKIYLPGKDDADLPKSKGEMVVQLPPSMSDSDVTPLKQAVEGETAILTCDASGVPPPVISWSRANGKAMPNGQQTIYGTKLELRNVSTEHGGVYRCKADNNVRPPATIDVTLQIRTKPVATPFRPAYGQARDKNLEVELACIVSGDPQPDLYWYYIKNMKTMTMVPITDDHKHEVQKIGMYPGHNRRETDQWLTLRILQLQSGDYGTYMCMGKNRFGNGSAFLQLYSTPTCQGALCQFDSRKLSASSYSVSKLLVSFTILLAILMARTER